MPPVDQERSAPQASEVVDLTTSPTMSTRSRKRSAAQILAPASSSATETPHTRPHGSPATTPGPSTKRQRTDHDRDTQGEDGSGTARPPAIQAEVSIEEINLVDDEDPLSVSLQRQREQQVKDQNKPAAGHAGEEEKESKLNSLTCAICLEQPTDLTATSCGHLFCNECLVSSLIAGETAANGETRKSSCPICRKTIARKKIGTDVIPLVMMTRGVMRKGKTRSPALVRSDASVA